jgi:hypothetical protein
MEFFGVFLVQKFVSVTGLVSLHVLHECNKEIALFLFTVIFGIIRAFKQAIKRQERPSKFLFFEFDN